MRVLLVIPSVIKRGKEPDVVADLHPTMDYFALERALNDRGAEVDFLDHDSVAELTGAKRDFVLAVKAFFRRAQYHAIFTNSENVAIPLALMLATDSHRPRHVSIGHRISAPKKRPFFSVLKAHRQIDKLFVYAGFQYRYGRDVLRIPQQNIEHIQFHADTQFFRPMACDQVEPLVSAAGLEWRDYETMIEAVQNLPDVEFKLAAASPWSKHGNRTERIDLPGNVTARRYDYKELRDLYASSRLVVVPLLETDFQAGITTILEAMAMGKPVVVTKTTGQTDVVVDGETGLYVPVGDPAALRIAIGRLIGETEFAVRLGANGRKWVEDHASLDQWSAKIAESLLHA